MKFKLYTLKTLDKDIIVSIIATHLTNSHLLYFSNQGVRPASTANPQPGVDYDDRGCAKVVGVDIV